MKLKHKKHIIIKYLFILLFMCFITYETICYLYINNNISNEEYMKLLLGDIYTTDNNVYDNIMSLVTKKLMPNNIIEINKNIKQSSNYVHDPYSYEIKDPFVYIYSTNQLSTYIKTDSYSYDKLPNVVMSSYILKDYLNSLDISTSILNEEVNSYNINNIFENKDNIKYYIDFENSNLDNTSITIDGIKYARIRFIANNNYNNTLILNSKLNEKYPGISMGIKLTSDDISSNTYVIEFGSVNNGMNEVINTIKAFSYVFSEMVKNENRL